MNLTLHIVRKDLRRLRWWLAAWVVLLLLPIALGAGLLANNPFRDEEWHLDNVLEWIHGLQFLVGYLLTILLLQDDAVLGTQQFWLTRPISRGRLFGAKMLGVFVVLALLPIAVALPWWLWHGIGLAPMAMAAFEFVALAVLVAVPAIFIATITETLSRAVLWTLVLAAFTLTSGAFLPLFGASVFAGAAAGFVCLATVAVWLFVTRRRSWRLLSFALLMPPLTVAAIVFFARFRPDQPPREHHVERATGVTVKFERAFANRFVAQRTEGGVRMPKRSVQTNFSVQGVAREILLMPLSSQQTFRWPESSGSDFSFPYWHTSVWHVEPLAAIGLREPAPDSETEQWQVAERVRRNQPPITADWRERLAREGRQLSYEVYLQPSLVARMATEPPTFEADIWLRLSRPEIVYELGLQPGQRVRAHGFTAQIKKFDPSTSKAAAHVTLLETWPGLLSSRLREELERQTWHAHHNAHQLIAVNRARGEIGGARSDKPRKLFVYGVGIAWHVVSIGPGMVRRGDQWVQRPGWMENASLALLRFTDEALFKREVKVERVPVENARARATGGP